MPARFKNKQRAKEKIVDIKNISKTRQLTNTEFIRLQFLERSANKHANRLSSVLRDIELNKEKYYKDKNARLQIMSSLHNIVLEAKKEWGEFRLLPKVFEQMFDIMDKEIQSDYHEVDTLASNAVKELIGSEKTNIANPKYRGLKAKLNDIFLKEITSMKEGRTNSRKRGSKVNSFVQDYWEKLINATIKKSRSKVGLEPVDLTYAENAILDLNVFLKRSANSAFTDMMTFADKIPAKYRNSVYNSFLDIYMRRAKSFGIENKQLRESFAGYVKELLKRKDFTSRKYTSAEKNALYPLFSRTYSFYSVGEKRQIEKVFGITIV